MTFDSYLQRCNRHAYSECASDMHTGITHDVLGSFLKDTGMKPPARILDVGSGPGEALKYLASQGFTDLVGTNIVEQDRKTVQDAGFECYSLDMHHLAEEFGAGYYDAVIARHVLEHSPAPGFVLAQIHYILHDGGFLYVEIPCGGYPASQHEANANHFSILHDAAWPRVIQREGFEIMSTKGISITLVGGEDKYLSFTARVSVTKPLSRHSQPYYNT